MATIEQKIRVEHTARALLAEQGIPEPTYIEYGFTCIRLLWEESRLILRVDIDDEATTEHVVLIDALHPSQPPLPPDDVLFNAEHDYDPLILVGPPSPN
jgi:hypothetical protein